MTPTEKAAAEVLAKKILQAVGKQNPVMLVHALLLCIQMIDAAHNGPRKDK